MRFFFIACAIVFALPAAAAADPARADQGTQSPPSKPIQAEPVQPVLPSDPGLYAVIYTSMGHIVCRLFQEDAPKTVANFQALATGSRAWTDPVTGKTRRTPLYNGTTFHRVIPDFMIQGGDPLGDGRGGPGYEFADEIDPNRNFDKPGVLAMANSGPNTNGCQFFITTAPAPHLNGHYSIFGEVVSGQEVVDAISQVPRNSDDKPLTPVKIIRVSIRRVPGSGGTPAKSR